ncbi:hypothetical protein HGRIS_013079 [Hohenbuehelia grisea]|uniref:SET domain-containing protein n=1 Tax=Hohenbuehelia grisea TaxID=104357 RepID=A0ABR3IUI4_9AGAR
MTNCELRSPVGGPPVTRTGARSPKRVRLASFVVPTPTNNILSFMQVSDASATSLSPSNDAPWDDLLEWLVEGHGMKVPEHICRKASAGAGFGLYAAKPCPPSTSLFTIPAKALMNLRTLAPHYPDASAISATCLIALHLLLNRPQGDSASLDPLFGPYISVLPVDFSSHPLAWLVRCGREPPGCAPCEEKLLQALPPSYTKSLSSLYDRFLVDWKNISKYISSHPEALRNAHAGSPSIAAFQNSKDPLIVDFVWAWLNVNTRCIYRQLKASRSHPDNLTLCPILDFANHTSDFSSSISPVSSLTDIWQAPSKSPAGDDFTFISSSKFSYPEGAELFLNYGAHSNRTLFVEYGFINRATLDEILEGSFSGEVDVEDILQPMFTSIGDAGREARMILDEEGYWGDWTLHSCPPPAYPSYRVIVALRLLCIFTAPAPREQAIKAWRETLLGLRDRVSEDNETAWRQKLAICCRAVMERAEIRCASPGGNEGTGEGAGWVPWMWQNIAQVWQEEYYVAKAVEISVMNNEMF